jgi:hypothetical protein
LDVPFGWCGGYEPLNCLDSYRKRFQELPEKEKEQNSGVGYTHIYFRTEKKEFYSNVYKVE